MDGLTEASMFEAVRRHDPKYDGRFYFSATNSEIYCLPSCHVRTPLERNILFFGSKAREKHTVLRVEGGGRGRGQTSLQEVQTRPLQKR